MVYMQGDFQNRSFQNGLSRIDIGDVQLRVADDTDKPLCEKLFCQNHEQALIAAGWDEQQRKKFLHRQFTIKEHAFSESYPTAIHDIICINNKAVGRMLLVKSSHEITLIDFSLLSDWCGKGIGEFLIQQLVNDADDYNRAIKLQVEVNNPAIRLYQRKGFTKLDSDGVYVRMIRPAKIENEIETKRDQDNKTKKESDPI